jgi:hypothetical protein
MTREEEIKDVATDFGYMAAGGSPLRPAYCTGFCDGAKWADEHPNWISVEDKLPPYDEMVLLYCDSWDIPHVCERVEECGGDVYYNDEGRMLEDKPSYWMPRPKLPRKGGKQ